ncbi:DUF1566 domain-containing protein [Maribacter sp. 2-571]|uniref:Lcl domain-containing protein n=1 Tax=Maribacter sp. 2-571 TaxID=3417569 RepID=UPI003D32C757
MKNLKILYFIIMGLLFSCAESDEETIEITITVSDLSITIDENPNSGLSLGTIDASTNQGDLTYSIIEQSPDNAIAINSSTGEFTVLTESLFDFETNPTITGIVRVENGDIFETANFTILLIDVQELVVNDFIITMDEHPNKNQSLGFIEVQTDQNDLVFSLGSIGCSSAANSGLHIIRETGEVIVLNSSSFDYETNSELNCFVNVTANDIEYTADIVITLTDIPDPILTVSNFTIDIDENPQEGTLIGFIDASTTHGIIDYHISSQSVPNALTIDSNTGELKIANSNAFNYEGNNPIEANVSVHNNGVFASVNITINLNDVNEQDLQTRLDNGETPCEIYQSDNSLLNQLYGLSYQGGLIFYLNTTDCSGMISAPIDQSANAEWGCEGTNIADAQDSSIGFGLQNTIAIVNTCSTTNIAAEICYTYSLNGNDEWYLPSKDELNLLYTNLKVNGFGNFSNDWYWSSTEFEDQSSYDDYGFEAAWLQSFDDGNQATYDVGIKRYENNVRAVRSF